MMAAGIDGVGITVRIFLSQHWGAETQSMVVWKIQRSNYSVQGQF